MVVIFSQFGVSYRVGSAFVEGLFGVFEGCKGLFRDFTLLELLSNIF